MCRKALLVGKLTQGHMSVAVEESVREERQTSRGEQSRSPTGQRKDASAWPQFRTPWTSAVSLRCASVPRYNPSNQILACCFSKHIQVGTELCLCQAGLSESTYSKLVVLCSMLGECFGSRRRSQGPGGCCLVKLLQRTGRICKDHKGKNTKPGVFDYGMVHATPGMLVSDGTHFYSVEGGDFAPELVGLIDTALNWMWERSRTISGLSLASYTMCLGLRQFMGQTLQCELPPLLALTTHLKQ